MVRVSSSPFVFSLVSNKISAKVSHGFARKVIRIHFQNTFVVAMFVLGSGSVSDTSVLIRISVS